MRDQLKVGLSGAAQEPGKQEGPSISELAEKIKSISCTCDGSTDPVEKNMSLSGGVLHYKMNIKHDNAVMLDAQHWVAKELNK